MFCYKCGEQVKEGHRFCPRCGADLTVPQRTGYDQRDRKRIDAKRESLADSGRVAPGTKKKSPKKAIVAIVIAAAVIALAAVAVFVVVPMLNKSKTKTGNVSFKEIPVLTNGSEEELKTQLVKIVNTSDGSVITGTGFFSANGYLITASNVVDTDGEIRVIYPDGAEVTATLVSNDLYNNMAILKVDDPPVKALEFSRNPIADSATFRVIGFNEQTQATEVVVVTGIMIDSKGSRIISIDQPLDRCMVGAPVIDEYGAVAGMVTLADSSLDFALAEPAQSTESTAENLAENQVVSQMEEPVRVNQYTEAAKETYGVSEEDLYQEGTFIRGELTTITNIKFSVDQKNSKLIRLHYDASDDPLQGSVFFGENGEKATVTVETDQGTYSCMINQAKIAPNDVGEILIDLDDFSGTAQRILISPVLGVYSMDAEGGESERTMEIVLETYDKGASAKTDDRAEINAAFLNYLTRQGIGHDLSGDNYISIEYGNEDLPPMIFLHNRDADVFRGFSYINMAIYDNGNLIEIPTTYEFVNEFEGGDSQIILSQMNGAAMEDMHTEFYTVADDPSLYVYWRNYCKNNYLDQYSFSDGKFHLVRRIEGRSTDIGPEPVIDHDQAEINSLLANADKCYTILVRRSDMNQFLTPETDNDEYTYLSYDQAVTLLSQD